MESLRSRETEKFENNLEITLKSTVVYQTDLKFVQYNIPSNPNNFNNVIPYDRKVEAGVL